MSWNLKSPQKHLISRTGQKNPILYCVFTYTVLVYYLRPIIKKAIITYTGLSNSEKYVNLCTQYFVRACFAHITVSMKRGMVAISLKHCWGVMEATWSANWFAWYDFVLLNQPTCLTWPHRESMGYCQEEDEWHPTQQNRQAEGNYQRNTGFYNTSAVPQADRLHATPHWCSNYQSLVEVCTLRKSMYWLTIKGHSQVKKCGNHCVR